MTRKRILIVDDDAEIRALGAGWGRLPGLRSLQWSGRSAACTSGRPNLVVIDVVLPGMNGIEPC